MTPLIAIRDSHPRSGAPWRDLPERYGPYTTWRTSRC